MGFKQWFEDQQATLGAKVNQHLQRGAQFAGQPYPVGGEEEELAAAVQGKKPVALIRAILSPGHPAYMSNPKIYAQAKNVPATGERALLHKLLLQAGLNPKLSGELTIMSIKGTYWLAVGRDERNVRELVRLWKLHDELCATSHVKVCEPLVCRGVTCAIKKGQKLPVYGDLGFEIREIHRKIGALLGYHQSDIDAFAPSPAQYARLYPHKKYPQFDPTRAYHSEVPFSMRDMPKGTGTFGGRSTAQPIGINLT